jgi:hypothetical protein
VLRTTRIRSDERQIDFGLHGCGEFNLGAFRRVSQTLQCHLVTLTAQIKAFIFSKLINQPINNPLVDIVTAKVRVAVCGLDFNYAFADLKDRDIERSAAEVVDCDGFVLLLIETVSQRGRRRLVDDALYIESGNLAGVFGRLSLRVIEICGNGDDGFGNLLA